MNPYWFFWNISDWVRRIQLEHWKWNSTSICGVTAQHFLQVCFRIHESCNEGSMLRYVVLFGPTEVLICYSIKNHINKKKILSINQQSFNIFILIEALYLVFSQYSFGVVRGTIFAQWVEPLKSAALMRVEIGSQVACGFVTFITLYLLSTR